MRWRPFTHGDGVIVSWRQLLPTLCTLTAMLADDKGQDFVDFDEAAAACLERDAVGRWQLLWLLSPALLA